MKKFLVLASVVVLVGVMAVFALGSIASAQSPTPTPNQNTTPYTNPGGGFGWGMGHGHMMGGGFGPGPMMGNNFERGGGPRDGGNSLISAAAKAFGMTESDLLTQWQGGKTLAEIAASKNVDTAKLISDYLQPFADQLKTAVTNNQLTQAQADAMLALHKANAEAQLNFKYTANSAPQPGFGMFGRGMMHGWWGQTQPQQTTPAN